MDNNKKARNTALLIMAITWYIVANIFIATYVRLNWLPEAYDPAYWVACLIYALGVYWAVASYFITKSTS